MPHNSASSSSPVRVIFGGDVMLGRLVAGRIRQFGPGYPLGPVAARLRAADLTVINLECALTNASRHWSGRRKAFYFGAPPEAAESLVEAGVDLVSVANNHVLDFDERGLRDTLAQLRLHGMHPAGAGDHIAAASAPALIDCHGLRFGMTALCDHQKDFAAGRRKPGIAWLDTEDEAGAVARLRDVLAPLRHAGVDWPILSLHWGPNMARRPSENFRRLAHAAIDLGWKIVFGHSAHVFQGVELVRGCPILYAAGDLVDDYAVDPEMRNDQQLLFELVIIGDKLERIVLHPLEIAHCQVSPASAAAREAILVTMTGLCAELGTPVQRIDGEARIVPPSDAAPQQDTTRP